MANKLIDIAVEKNIMEKAGSWYSINGEKLGQGKKEVLNKLNENSKLLKDIKNKIN